MKGAFQLAEHLSLGVSRRRRATVVTVAGEVDVASGPELQHAIEGALTDSDKRDLVIDLREVGFIDVAGMRTLLVAHDRAQKAGRRLLVINVPAPARRLLELTQADKILNLAKLPR